MRPIDAMLIASIFLPILISLGYEVFTKHSNDVDVNLILVRAFVMWIVAWIIYFIIINLIK